MPKKDEEFTEEQLSAVPMLVVPQVPKSDLAQGSIVPSQGVVWSKPVDDDESEDQDDLEIEEDEEEEEDPFLPIINRMARTESPTVRDAMLATECFGRLWFDSEDASYCPEQDCHLRPLCEKAYHKTIEALEGDLQVEEELEDLDPAKLNNLTRDEIDEEVEDDFAKVRSKRKLQRKRKGSRKCRKRLPYIDQGENSDRMAKSTWLGLGSPPAMTGKWRWPSAETLRDRKTSAKLFVDRYGGGLLVNRRSGYHSYFYNGMHVVRFWVNSKKAAWVDMCHEVSEWARVKGMEIEPTTVKDKKHNFNFYPFRTKVRGVEDQQLLTQCILDALPNMKVR